VYGVLFSTILCTIRTEHTAPYLIFEKITTGMRVDIQKVHKNTRAVRETTGSSNKAHPNGSPQRQKFINRANEPSSL
jgi:hypothetical protein